MWPSRHQPAWGYLLEHRHLLRLLLHLLLLLLLRLLQQLEHGGELEPVGLLGHRLG